MVSTENKAVQDILAVQANELQALQKGSHGVRQDSSAFSVLPLATLPLKKISTRLAELSGAQGNRQQFVQQHSENSMVLKVPRVMSNLPGSQF